MRGVLTSTVPAHCAGTGQGVALPVVRPPAHRLCEAPVGLRYVGRYRCEAIQCRGDNIQPTYR
ncbi:MAG: hypothetical protein LBM98_01965 [Oscillospiraceae bacterium]|nr:hypothetical protein [Oscillospiraceae bacterium]